MLRLIAKRLFFPVLKPVSSWYFSKPRKYAYQNLKVTVNPRVFFPHLTISTKLLLDYLENKNLRGKRVLELGAGTGIISLRCAQRGADVTASDISSLAIENIQQNITEAGISLSVIKSDLFDEIDSQFDLIVINPPYYPKNPKNEEEKAWYCGAEFEYFKKLGKQLKLHLTEKGKAIMILSEDCQVETISKILTSSGLFVKKDLEISKFGEVNFLFSVC